MKNIKLLLLGISILAFSCEKEFLEKTPTNKLSEELILTSIDGLNLALKGTYRRLSHNRFDGLNYQAIGEVKGGDVVMASSNNYTRYINVYQYSVIASNRYSKDSWLKGYEVIDNVNLILASAKKMTENTDQVRGEALALRGYTLLLLATMYSDKPYSVDPSANSVVLRLEPYNAADDPGIARSTVQQVYDQIISDLTTAESLLDNTGPKGQFTKRAVQGVLARAYLDMGSNGTSPANLVQAANWARACHADQDLDSADYVNGFYDHNNETIFGYHYTQTDNGGYTSHPSFWYVNIPGGGEETELYGYSTIWYTPEFYAIFDANDIRGIFFESGWNSFFGVVGCYISYKFRHRDNKLSIHDLIRMRVAEMYLIEAEAEALANQGIAQEALFKVQDRARYGAVQSTNTGQVLLDEIYLERKKELYGEGFGGWDLMRLNLPVDRSSLLHWGYTETSIPANADVMPLPIPQDEIDANNLITESDQNGGY